MMPPPLLSVIVPVYNTANYLHRCLDSIVNQTYKNLEIILIDDGSSDGSELICDEYEKKDTRIKLIHQANGGESHARNVGLLNSIGDVIAFVDCDDWLEIDMYESMMHEMIESNLDVIAASWCKQYDDRKIDMKNRKKAENGVFGRDKFLEYIYRRDDYQGFAFMWNKLYARKTLTQANGELISFDEGLKLGGDVLYLAKAALNANRIKFLDLCLYHYYQRSDSGMHALTCNKMSDWLESYRQVISLMEKKNISIDIIGYIKRFMAYHASNAVEIAIKEQDDKAKKEFQELMKKYESDYICLNFEYPERIERYKKLIVA